jgi:large subunit ribosomal protein L10
LAISRDKKNALIKGYVEQIQGSQAIIITQYRGLKVKDLQQLRAKIRQANGSFAVVKNTLAERALAESGLPVPKDLLVGPIGIGFCGNNITDFTKDHDLLQIKGGLLGNRVIDEAGVRNLAKLPPLAVLRAQLLGLINAPASQLVGVLSGGVRQIVNVVNAYAEKGNAPAEA